MGVRSAEHAAVARDKLPMVLSVFSQFDIRMCWIPVLVIIGQYWSSFRYWSLDPVQNGDCHAKLASKIKCQFCVPILNIIPFKMVLSLAA